MNVETFTTEHIEALARPCVYIFMEAGKPAYIGSSTEGIFRFGSPGHHHSELRTRSEILVFWLTKEWKRGIRQVEERLIRLLQPPYNKRMIYSPHPAWRFPAEIELFLDRYEQKKVA